jgi:MATE family multidrug resistance protein
MATMTFTSILHFYWCHLLVNIYDLDVIGVSIATCITYTSNLIVITIYCSLKKDLKTSFFFPTKESFTKIAEYLKIGIPSALMLCLEWSGYEILLILSGYIDVNSAGACSIILNIFYLFLTIVSAG